MSGDHDLGYKQLFAHPELVRDLLAGFTPWIAHLQKREFGGVTFDEVEGLLEDTTMGERFVRKYATWADAIEDKGLQRGLAQGREEGRQEGRQEGRAEGLDALRITLKRQLEKRFGELTPAAAARIDGAATADIERWFDRVLDADSVDAALLD